ncbi:putative uncharacterized protein DDB_G0282133 [Lucilia cuprina]|uniref:putative uncharacterized protein DDB_G0282133 n=1 Tax=Lucilia cuprina TaxID=7375 RepID=UPI001F0547FD|nr:putative uncharacterized protein DDB_G0282133 [Lucilia cuprina]
MNDADNSLVIDAVKIENSDSQSLRNETELLTTDMYQSDISPTKELLSKEIETKRLAIQSTNNLIMKITTVPEDKNNHEEYLSITTQGSNIEKTTTPVVWNNYANNIEQFNVQNTLPTDNVTNVYLKNSAQKNESNSEVQVQSEINSFKSQVGNGLKDSGISVNISYEHKSNIVSAEVETTQTTYSSQDLMEDNDEDKFIETSTSIVDNNELNNNINKQSILTLELSDISNRSNSNDFEMEVMDYPNIHNENLMSSIHIDRNGAADATSSTIDSFKNYKNSFNSETTEVSLINKVPIDVNNISGKNSFHNFFEDSEEEDNLDTYTKIPTERNIDKGYYSSKDENSESLNISFTVDSTNSTSNTTQSFIKDNKEQIVISRSNSSDILYNNGTSNFVQNVSTNEEFTTETIMLSDSQHGIGESTALSDEFNESPVDSVTATTIDNSFRLTNIEQTHNITNNFTSPNENTETVTEVVWLTQSSSYQKPSIIIENIPYETSISGPLYKVSNDLTNTAKVTILKPEEKSDHLSELIALIGNSLQDSTQTSELLKQNENVNKNVNEYRLQKIQEDITSTVNCHTGTMSFPIPSSPSTPSVEFESEEWSTFKNNQLNNDSLSKSGNLLMKKNVNADDGNAVADIDDNIDVHAYVNAADDVDVYNDEGITIYSDEKNMRLEMKVKNKGSIYLKTENSDNDRVVENENNDNGSTVQYSTNNVVETSQYEGGINDMSTIENKLHNISRSESNVMTSKATSSHDKHEMADNKYNKKDYLNKGNEMIIKNSINPNSMSEIKTPNKDDEIDDVGRRPNNKTENIFNNLLKTQPFPATTPYNSNSNMNTDKNILASAQTKEEITTTNWWHSLPYAEIRKFLNSILDSVTSTDNINLNGSVDSTTASATVPKTSSQTNVSKLKTIKGRKSKKEQWPIWVLNNIWSSLL